MNFIIKKKDLPKKVKSNLQETINSKKIIDENISYKPYGFILRRELIDGKDYHCEDFEIESAYTLDNKYIGNLKTALLICKKYNIKPEYVSPDSNVCSIGFCDKEQKWYGWSHRAIYGFGIGSKVSPGDCGFMPANKKEFIQEELNFWLDQSRGDYDVLMTEDYEQENRKGILIEYKYKRKADNQIMLNKHFSPYPDNWGKGTWIAKTLSDAKEMAIDFAREVS